MPPEPLNWDRKDLFKERKQQERSESLGPVARWRDSPHRDFNRWNPSTDFRRPPGHGKQGGWHLVSDDTGHGYGSSRSEKMLEDESFRPSFARGEGRYGRNGRDNRGSYSQRDSKGHSWETNSLSPITPGRPNDMNSEERPQDDNLADSNHPHSDFGSTWEQIQSRNRLDRVGGPSGIGVGQNCDRENSLGSIDWKPLKWTRSGSMSSRGSGFSHSSSSKSIGVIDSNEAKVESQPKNVTSMQSPSGDATACVTSAAPSDETSSRKKARLGWGEGLAKYEKKKDPCDVIMNKDEPLCSAGNVESVRSMSPNMADKSPRVPVVLECASPATPCSVACSSSPGVEEKSFSKAASIDNDNSNLCGSPSPEFHSHQEVVSFNLDLNSIANVSLSLQALLQSNDPCPMESSIMRPTAMNKLLIWKDNISKVLEVTESEIDMLENELKLLNSDPGGSSPHPAASSSLPVENSDKSCKEQVTATNLITRPAPLQISSSGDTDGEKMAIGNEEQGESCGIVRDEDMDSPGTATSKFVEQLPLLKVVSSDVGKNLDPVQPAEREAQCFVACKNKEKINLSACGNSKVLLDSEIVAPVHDGLDVCAGVVDNIFSSNKESANRASDIFSKLLPNDNCKVDIAGHCIYSSSKNDSLIKEKFKKRKQHLRFMERVVTLKYKAFQHLWKEDMRLSTRKYRAKSHKKCELSMRTINGYQKHRSSIRSRFSTPAGNLSLVPTTEIVNFTNKLLSDSQVKVYRNTLKMPALILDKKEKLMTRFVSSNGLVDDPLAVEKERAFINPWTQEEKESFIDKLATFGKDFKKIASFFDHKTTADCVEFYYKHHKSACFEKAKKKPGMSKQGKSSTYMINPGTKWNREVNAASLDILGAASVIASRADGSTRNRAGRLILGGYNNTRPSRDGYITVERSSNFDVVGSDRETVAADVLAGICGSLSSEAVSSCITSSIDPVDGYREMKNQKLDSLVRRPLAADVQQIVDDETCSDDSCGKIDSSDWTDEEKSSFIQAVSSYGKDFVAISRRIRTKSQNQCKVFFSKARKCLGLDLIRSGPGNLETCIGDDSNGGQSGTEDACVVETGSGISSDKFGCKMDEDLPLSVVDMAHDDSDPEEMTNLQMDPLRSVESNAKGDVDCQDTAAHQSSDASQMEDGPKPVFDGHSNVTVVPDRQLQMDPLRSVESNAKGDVDRQDTAAHQSSDASQMEDGPKPVFDGHSNVTVVLDRQSESVLARRSPVVSADTDAVRDDTSGEGILVTQSVGEGISSNLNNSEVSSDGGEDKLEGRDERSTTDTSGCELQISVHDSNSSGSASDMVAEDPISGLATGLHPVSVKLNSMQKSSVSSFPLENLLATANSLPQRSVAIDCEKALTQDSLSSTLDLQEGRDKQQSISSGGDDCQKHLTGLPVLTNVDPTRVLRGYPLHMGMKEFNGHISCGNPDRDINGCMPKDGLLQFGNGKPRCSQVDFPLVHQKIERRTDAPKSHSWSSPDTDKPSRDVKLFGKILTNPSKSSSSINENEEKGSLVHNLGSKSANLKFSGVHNSDGNSGLVKFDCSNYLGLENVPRRNYSYWEGNKVQNGHPSLPDSAILLAKYPAAFVNFPASSPKMDQQPLQAVVRSDCHINGASVFPSREINSSSSSGIVDYQHVFSRHRDGGGAKVPPPFTVDVKQRQDMYDISRRNGFEAISGLQQQGRGVVGMNVVGRGGLLVGGACTGVSDPVAAIRMHYAKAEQFGGQGSIIREEESWRGKGDVGR